VAAGGAFAGVAAGLYLPASGPPTGLQLGFAGLAAVAAGTLAAWQVGQEAARRGAASGDRVGREIDVGRAIAALAARSQVLLLEGQLLPAMPLGMVRAEMTGPGFDERPLPAVPAPTTLFQLPPTISDFTGREEALAAVRAAVLDPGEEPMRAVVISAIAGKAGVGKTTLAVHSAHELRPNFPDGQLYVNLRGAEAQRLHPAEALTEFLRALGVEGPAIPAGLEERARLYRDRLADRRVLVVLDNAADEAQVRPLLPGSAGSAVLVTSRSRLAGLEGARTFALDVLPADEAVELLGRVAGRDRVDRDGRGAARVVRLCGYLPLAVRIAGARLASRPHWSLAALADLLADESTVLSALEIGDLGVRASFQISVRELPEDLQRLFRMLGLLEAPDFPAWTASALLHRGPAQAAADIERLVDAQLVEVAGADAAGQLRYRFHDLIRVYAREQLRALEPVTMQADGLHRVVDCYLTATRSAVDALEPAGLQSVWRTAVPGWPAPDSVVGIAAAEPVLWFEAERLSLVSAVEQGAPDLPELAWELSTELSAFFDLHAHWDDWQRTHTLAMATAERAGSRAGVAYTLWSLIRLRRYQARFSDAIDAAERSLSIFREISDQRGEAAALVDLARVFWYQARFSDAAASAERCLQIFRQLGDLRWTARTMVDIGDVRRDQGRYEEAAESCLAAYAAFNRLGDARWSAIALVALGRVERDRGQPQQAIARFEAGVAAFRQLKDRIWENYTLRCLGDALRDVGRLDEALDQLEAAVAAFADLGDRRWQMRSLHSLGEVHRELGHPDLATTCYLTCLPAFQETGDRLWQGKTLASLGRLAGEGAEAHVLWREAYQILQDIGSPEAAVVAGWLAGGQP